MLFRSAAKQYKKAPIQIANEIVAKLTESKILGSCEAIMPGFVNMSVDNMFLANYVLDMSKNDKFGLEKLEEPQSIVVDYGGPNVAKSLHVGHLRPAIIGEAIKRILRYAGNNVIGDAHFGDWGLQIGLIIKEISVRQPELAYFNQAHIGDYPTEAPFTMSELEEIYP